MLLDIDMFFVVRSNDSFNFPLGLIRYIVIVVIGEPWANLGKKVFGKKVFKNVCEKGLSPNQKKRGKRVQRLGQFRNDCF